MLDLNNYNIDFNCPKCKYLVSIQLADVKCECKVFCHNCKASIQLKDKNASSLKGIRDINNALNDINNTLKNLGK